MGKTLVRITVPKMALKYFRNFSKGNFTNYNMFNAMLLQSQYSQRLYENCSRWKDTKWFTLGLDKMKEVLNIPDSYTVYNIKKLVLDVAQKELLEKTELKFTYKEKKEGKKIVGFDFTVIKDEAKTKQFNTPTPPEAVVELILCKVESLPISAPMKRAIAESGLITEAEAGKFVNEFIMRKSSLNNPVGWIISALNTQYGIILKPSK